MSMTDAREQLVSDMMLELKEHIDIPDSEHMTKLTEAVRRVASQYTVTAAVAVAEQSSEASTKARRTRSRKASAEAETQTPTQTVSAPAPAPVQEAVAEVVEAKARRPRASKKTATATVEETPAQVSEPAPAQAPVVEAEAQPTVEKAKKAPTVYNQFVKEFSAFLKESAPEVSQKERMGVCGSVWKGLKERGVEESSRYSSAVSEWSGVQTSA